MRESDRDTRERVGGGRRLMHNELQMMGEMIRKAAYFYLFKQKVFLSEHSGLCSETSMFPETFPVSDWLMLVKIQRRVGFGHVGPPVPVWFASPDWVRLPVIFSIRNVRYIISATISAPRVLWFVTGCFRIITAVIFSEYSCKLLEILGHTFRLPWNKQTGSKVSVLMVFICQAHANNHRMWERISFIIDF